MKVLEVFLVAKGGNGCNELPLRSHRKYTYIPNYMETS